MTDKVSLQKKHLAWRRMEAMVLLGEDGGWLPAKTNRSSTNSPGGSPKSGGRAMTGTA
ncbi:hypothetical protein [Salibaculum griseiflavum]|uniref:hypothetical protein n=1 Tax=Salibaculum griseiflavum TaxID=1914409 RepID=UPI001C3919D7|nr:hypothetical protein [Salibaculum griseiflavum]